MRHEKSFEPKLYNEEGVENIEEEEKDEIPWNTKIFVDRHPPYIKERIEKYYWSMNINKEHRQDLVNFLVDEEIVDEEEAKKIFQAKFIEDELINLVDNEKLDTPKFFDFLVEIGFDKNSEETKKKFDAFIINNREFNEIRKETDTGSLTENEGDIEGGKEMTKRTTIERLIDITGLENKENKEKKDEKIDIIFLHSPTEFMDSKEKQGYVKGFGSRTKDTIKETLDTIGDEIKNETELGKYIQKNIRIAGIGPQEKLRELNIFYIFDASDPWAYFNALEKEFGKDYLEPYCNIVKKYEGLRKEMGVEGPEDIAERFKSMLEIIKKYHKEINKEESEEKRKLVIWINSHSDFIRCFAQHGLKADEEDIKGYFPDYNEGLEINITPDDEVITEFKGKEYKIDL